MKQGMRGAARLTEADEAHIVKLLNSDLLMTQIAARVGYSKTTIAKVNRKYGIREYRGMHSTWHVKTQ